MVSVMLRQVGMPLACNGGMGPVLVAPCGEGDWPFVGLTWSIWRTGSISESHCWSLICGTSGAISRWSSECSMVVLPTLVCCSALLGLASTSFQQILFQGLLNRFTSAFAGRCAGESKSLSPRSDNSSSHTASHSELSQAFNTCENAKAMSPFS